MMTPLISPLMSPLLTCELPGVPKLQIGKVREIFDLGNTLLLVATDRISAFDCVLPDPIPHKGQVLNQLSNFWFHKLDFVPNHAQDIPDEYLPEHLKPFSEYLSGRSRVVHKAMPLPVECVVRGYLAGSAWKEYGVTGCIAGQPLPEGLQLGDRLPEPLFTPATKSKSGHDENISWSTCRHLLGDEVAFQVRDWSIELYEHGQAYAAQCGIVIADTKFEFGMRGGNLLLIDECLTPDSSRFWVLPSGASSIQALPSSNFDKQEVRDYLESLAWNKQPPAPHLPSEMITKTSQKYLEVYTRLMRGSEGAALSGGSFAS